MSARGHRLGTLVVFGALGVLLGACGSGLYDASGVPLLENAGLACNDESQVVCGGVCTQEDASHCGAACEDCTAGTPVPAGAVAACVRASGATAGACGHECADGLLRCSTGCCVATAVTAGERFTCAVADDESVSCWGANGEGQLGDGTAAPRAVPGAVPSVSGATAVGAGAAHACAVVAGGAVRCWGSDTFGQVSGTPSPSPALSAVATPVGAGALAVVAGASHTCALLASGEVRCWGEAALIGGGVPVTAGATRLAAGRDHTCAVVAGAVRCWGANESGQLGDGGTAAATLPVTAIAGGMQHVGAGGGQTCAATGTSNGQSLDDAIRCWGDSVGETFGLVSPQLTPAIPVKDADQSTIRSEVTLVAVGRKHVCVRDRTEAIDCFGANDRGQLGGTPVGAGEAVTVPLPASPPAPIALALAAGAEHTCAIVSAPSSATGGRLRCWGANDSGQLGNGATEDPGTGIIVAPLGR